MRLNPAECMSWVSDVSETPAYFTSYCCWPLSSTISRLLPSSGRKLFLPVHSVPAPVCQLLYFARHCTVKLKMFSLFLCLFFMYYLCENYYKPVTVQDCVDNCVSWVPKLTLSDLQANWNRTHLYNLQGTYCITDLVMSTTVSILLNSTWLPCCPTLIIV